MAASSNQSGGSTFATGSAGQLTRASGRIAMGGVGSSQNPTTTTVPFTSLANHSVRPASLVVTTNPNATVVKSQNNVFNQMAVGQYLINGFSPNVAGVASLILKSPGNLSVRKSENNYNSVIRTRKIVMTGGWNYVTGKPVAAADAIDNLVNGTETFPTRAIPGRLVYLQNGNKTPLRTNYQGKTD